ncbi:type I 3-dehydroquinate dehydratase [[Eubacterium] cellulosolvens]
MSLICVTLLEESASKYVQAAAECKSKGADLIEIRLDYLQERLSLNILKKLAAIKTQVGLPIILTLRPTWEGGKFDKYEERRLDILGDGITSGFDYIDLELKVDEPRRLKLIELAKKHGVKTIISHHNFEHTPKWKNIFNKLKDCAATGGDIAKVVYYTKSINDVKDIIKAGLAAKNLDYKFTIMGLGPFGHITRLFGPVLGCKIVYSAITEGSEAVEGQIEVGTLIELWNILNIKED